MTENGVGPDLVTHNIVLSAYKMKLGQFGKAMDIFNSMRAERADSRPDIVTFTSIIHLYSVCGQIENCKAVFNAMLAEGIQPNIVSYNTLMAVYASHGMSKEAAAVFDQIKQNGFRPDVVSYTSLLNAYGRSQLPEKAREIFDMMKRNNCKPNLVIYNALIDAYGSNGLLPEAVEVLRQVEQDGIKPNIVSICTLLAPVGAVGRKYSEALGFLDDMGQVAEAESMFNMIKVSGCCPDVVAYTAMLHAYNSAEHFPLCLGHLFKAASELAISHAKNWAKASAIFLEMEENGIQPDSIACSALRAFNKGGQPSKVLVLAKYMREKAIPLNDAVFFEMVSACSM
ncbi:hypothetical protein GOBAR_DD36022 [Gossypium barbadense]|nr:hypothetical protein GOBAR_DD36022 [Gossypium barbadense]